MAECGKKYGPRLQFVCRLPKGHKGFHAIRRSLRQIVKEARRG